jgi:hypothetical protein
VLCEFCGGIGHRASRPLPTFDASSLRTDRTLSIKVCLGQLLQMFRHHL